MADAKWVPGLTPTLPAADAATRVIAARLKAVQTVLPIAAETPDDDADAVHQLRVTSRRATAALDIFRDFLPRRWRRKTRRVLRSLRRAAGDARDWDVFLEFLLDAAPGPATDALTGYAFGQRDAAQIILAGVVSEQGPKLDALAARLGAERPEDGPRTLAELGTAELAPLLADFTKAVAGRPTALADLHQLRIAGKQLRYAMEVFADCYGPAFVEDLYAAVERVQQILGDMQDAHVSVSRLTTLRDRFRKLRPKQTSRVDSGLSEVIAGFRRRLTQNRRLFRAWVADWRTLTSVNPLVPVSDQKPRVAGGNGSESPAGGGNPSMGRAARGGRGKTSGGSRSRPRG